MGFDIWELITNQMHFKMPHHILLYMKEISKKHGREVQKIATKNRKHFLYLNFDNPKIPIFGV